VKEVAAVVQVGDEQRNVAADAGSSVILDQNLAKVARCPSKLSLNEAKLAQ
jgi:hypothetical protein